MKKLDEIISISRLVLSGDEYLDDTIINNILELAEEIKLESNSVEQSDRVQELEARVSKLTLALDICKMERGENK